ncbi:MAG TPA: peptidoglycan DD-metalloendopeptidase family protein [Dokdonella sp.]
MKRYFTFRPTLVLAAALLLEACASTGPAPVEDRSLDAPRSTPPARAEARPAPQPVGGSYKVQRGDTLYSIAFRHGLDYRDLAGWNGIGAPYTIFVGQDLRLAPKSQAAGGRPLAAPPPASRPASSAPAVAAAPAATVKPAASNPPPFEDVKEAPLAAAPAPAAASATPPVTASPPVAAAPKPIDATPVPPPAVAPPPQSASVSGDVAWRWPADGQVIGSFVAGDQTKQGIDIGGKAGDPVRAAADGTIVYSGNGLIGYGELIIVKHSPGFLSAYGHNRKRLVKEGDHVKSGQVIAEMGSSSASRDSLHFEIRKNGKPANPVDYLPRR